MQEGTKTLIDTAAASTTLLTMAAWLPPTAAFFTIVWTGIRIYEWYKTKGK